jgi:hypothetical protein
MMFAKKLVEEILESSVNKAFCRSSPWRIKSSCTMTFLFQPIIVEESHEIFVLILIKIELTAVLIDFSCSLYNKEIFNA